MLDQVTQLLSPLRRAVANLVARAVVQLVTDSLQLQVLQLSVLEDETRGDCERLQSYGLTSHPFAGAEAVVLFVGGLRDHPLVLAVDDRRYRKHPLQPGEVALYTDQGAYVLLKRGPVLEINQTLDLVNSGVLKVASTQVVGPRGAAVADSTATAASVSAQLNLVLARLRAHGLIA